MTVRAFIVLLLLTALVTAAGMAAFSGVGRSQERPCEPLDKAEATLSRKYGEELFVVGLMGAAAERMRMYVNPATRTWTILAQLPGENVACVMAVGRNIDLVPPRVAGQPL